MSFIDDEQGRSKDDILSIGQRLVPHLGDILDTVETLLPDVDDTAHYRVLDMGPATGLLTDRLLHRHPKISIHMVSDDFATTEMMRERLEKFSGRVTFEVGDFLKIDLGGPYDAAILGLATSSLENKSKRTLFSAVYAALRRGGRVIFVSQVRGLTEALEAIYTRNWEAMARAQGATDTDFKSSILSSTKYRTATLAAQLDWLAADGFENVDCFVKYWRFAVLAGDKV